ncbi:hypothetical protein Daesc_010504 [Daldinia eschscholtzii]|uniref:Uncharacterized protein n=1 Tax=Daldinia eschscholtzii TaxID=292717 RepID=A0AAX6M8F6_9PEZI
MRRISRLRRPSGLPISTPCSPIAPLPSTHDHTTTPEVEQVPKEEAAQLAEEEIYELESPTPTQWQTYVPPPQRSYAERLDDISDATYVPALTADGLETVGGLRNWWDRPEHWLVDFIGFKPLNSVLDPAVLETSVRRAVIEAFALKQAGREDELVKAWPIAGEDELSRLLSVEINVAPDGAVSLTGDVSAVLDSLAQKSEPTMADESVVGSTSVPVPSTEEAQKYKSAWGHGWKAVSLSDPRIKFAVSLALYEFLYLLNLKTNAVLQVTKRVFQLTGQLVHDHQLSSITDIRSLLHAVQKPPKPKTLTEEIQERRQDLVQIPNVSFATKRITRGDREKAVGRFKLIEEELKKRDLPLEGHGFVRKNTEISRFKGGV